jgi:hypothetical protein
MTGVDGTMTNPGFNRKPVGASIKFVAAGAAPTVLVVERDVLALVSDNRYTEHENI